MWKFQLISYCSTSFNANWFRYKSDLGWQTNWEINNSLLSWFQLRRIIENVILHEHFIYEAVLKYDSHILNFGNHFKGECEPLLLIVQFYVDKIITFHHFRHVEETNSLHKLVFGVTFIFFNTFHVRYYIKFYCLGTRVTFYIILKI